MRKKITVLVVFLFVLVGCSRQEGNNNTNLPNVSLLPSNSIFSSNSLPFDDPSNWQQPFPSSLIQGWSSQPILGALMPERYLFFADGAFYYAADEYGVERDRYYDGTWLYDGKFIQLTIKRKITIEGGEIVDAIGGSRAQYIEGGALIKYTFESGNYEHKSLTVQYTDEDCSRFGEFSTDYDIIVLDDIYFYASTAIVSPAEMMALWDTYEYLL